MAEMKRRKFLQTSAAGLAAGSVFSACSSAEPETAASEPKGPVPRQDDPRGGYILPGREKVFNPGGNWPIVRTDWNAKNVIVIMLDSFRADHLGAFGNSQAATPNLDQFAADSTFFTRSYPEGLPTIPVRTGLFTGRFTYPFRRWQVLYPEDHPLLAEILWSQGFRTALVSDVYHMHKPAYGFSRGFDDVTWIRGQEGDPHVTDPRVKVDHEPYFKARNDPEREAQQTITYLKNRHDWKTDNDHFTPRVMEAALDWIKAQPKRENLFLWVDSFCPHEPWDPPEKYLKMVAPNYSGKKLVLPSPGDVEGYLTPEELENVKALYRGVIAFSDVCVGYFLDEIKRLGMYENSLIVLATDHGEPFGDHGIVRKARPWGYEELAHTFLMIREPGGNGVKRVESYTQQTDITATILDYLTIPKLPHMTSESLMPLILGKEEKIRDGAVCCHYDASVNFRHDDWSYHYFLPAAQRREGSNLRKDGPELYNLRDDPFEQNNLIAQAPERAQEMDRMFLAFTEELLKRERQA